MHNDRALHRDPVRTRPLLAGDAASLSDFYLGLSPLTLHARFFVDSLRDPRALGLTAAVDQHTHLAVVAESIGVAGAAIIGVARAVVSQDDPGIAEFAVVVTDQWQRRGIGRALVKRLALDSWRMGIRRWRIVRLAGNDRVERLIETIGVRESSREQGGVVDTTFRLVPARVGVPS